MLHYNCRNTFKLSEKKTTQNNPKTKPKQVILEKEKKKRKGLYSKEHLNKIVTSAVEFSLELFEINSV